MLRKMGIHDWSEFINYPRLFLLGYNVCFRCYKRRKNQVRHGWNKNGTKKGAA